jgi:hypothetical protein
MADEKNLSNNQERTMKSIKYIITCFTLLIFISTAFAQESTMDKPLYKERWVHMDIEASVEKIDVAKRMLTLRGPDGDLVTLTATDKIKRFDEIKVGDLIQAKYLTFLSAEFREPTPEELETPLVVLAEAGRAPEGVDPAGMVGAVVKAVVTVVSFSPELKKVAIQGPRGNYIILPVMDDAVLMNLKLGETVIMTYAQAVAMSLEKIDR